MIKIYSVLFLIAFVFVSCFSVSTSFLFDTPFSLDSSMFLIIGKYWAQGHIPYVELWDQKGPIIFLVNAIGYLLAGDRIGVFIIQVMFLWIDTILLYQLSYSYYKSYKFSFGTIVVFLIAYAFLYVVGNTVEEYILPLLILAFSEQYKWFDNYTCNRQLFHKYSAAFIYGLVLSYALFSRLTNALGVCAGVAFIAVILIIHKKWIYLLYNFLFFLFGFLLLALPICLYFYVNGALGEMWYGTITYNLEYANTSSLLTTHTLLGTSYLVCCIFALLVSSFSVLCYRRIQGVYLFVVSSPMFLWIWNSMGYEHYSILCLPYLILAIIEVKEISINKKNRIHKYVINSVLISFIFIIIVLSVHRRYNKGRYYYIDATPRMTFYNDFLRIIPHEEKKSFVGYMISPIIYLYGDVMPCYPYFCLQDWFCDNGSSMGRRVDSVFSSCKAKWILAKESRVRYNVQEILDTRYEKHTQKEYERKTYILYHIKDSNTNRTVR